MVGIVHSMCRLFLTHCMSLWNINYHLFLLFSFPLSSFSSSKCFMYCTAPYLEVLTNHKHNHLANGSHKNCGAM